ncbi:MAG: M48 family metallopeptidase [Saprospiraceae bacterium]|jgi:predicted Zn-dependent protease|nr:M48 family metallopeptidase [Saprospiraceae bacterium]
MAKGKYFDGLTSSEHEATINASLQSLGIIISDSYGRPKFLNWNLEDISIEFNEFAKRVELESKTEPGKSIELELSEYLSIQDQLPKNLRLDIRQNPFKKLWIFVAISLFLLAFFVFGYFKILPFLAEKVAMNFPENYEKKLGQSVFESMKNDLDIDSVRSHDLQLFFNGLGYDDPKSVKVFYSKTEDINAFAIPGGIIVVHKGLLNAMSDYTELQGVLAHEFVHIQLKHSLRLLFRSLSSYLAISLVFGDINGILAVIIQNSNELRSLSYSRAMETEADIKGAALMVERDFDPEGMIKLMETLKTHSPKMESEVLKYLATHPDLELRIDNLEKAYPNKANTLNADSLIFKNIFLNLKNER